MSKESIFDTIATYITENGLHIKSVDITRPWGGFFVIDEADLELFKELYFPETHINLSAKNSPKAPQQRLSWQYHHRRAELWRLSGNVGVIRSLTNDEMDLMPMSSTEIVTIGCKERHRLVGLDTWSIVAEIWQHVDPKQPSDEADIVRVQDDYAR
jgi:mannose-6-phosphate isomerase